MSIFDMFTTRNVGRLDRLLRSVPALLVAVGWYRGWIDGWTAAVLAVLAGMLFMTSILGSCSIYHMLGFSTCPISGAPRAKG